MESKESLGQLSIIKALGKEKIGNNRLVLTSSDKVVDALSFILDTGCIQFWIECKLLDACKELLFEIIGWNFIVRSKNSKRFLNIRLAAPEAGTNFKIWLSACRYFCQRSW